MRAAGFSFENRKRSPSAIVGRTRTVSRSRVYGKRANIAISTHGHDFTSLGANH